MADVSPTGVQTSQGRSESTRSRCRECGELEGGKIKADPRSLMQRDMRVGSRFKMSSEEHEKLLLSVAFLFPFHLVWTREATVQ